MIGAMRRHTGDQQIATGTNDQNDLARIFVPPP